MYCSQFYAISLLQISVKWNGVEVETSSVDKSYPFKSMIDCQFSFNDVAKNTYMSAWGWLDDLPASCANFAKTPTAADGEEQPPPSGYDKRMAHIAESRSFFMQTPLFSDVFFQNRALVPGVAMEIGLTLNPPEFFLISADTNRNKFALKLESCELKIRTVEPIKEVVNDINKALVGGKAALYPITKSSVVFHTVPKQQVVHISNLLKGIFPSTIILGFLPDTALSSQLSTNPMRFQSFGLKQCQIYANGKPLFNRILDFQDDDHLRAFMKIQEDLCLNSSSNSITFTKEMMTHQYFFWTVDLTGMGFFFGVALGMGVGDEADAYTFLLF